MLNELSLFSGYAASKLAFMLAGIKTRTVLYCEIEPYCQEIIKARIRDKVLDDAPIWPDIRTFRGEQFRGLADLVTGGFPCQPFSIAGERKGEDDERNLWPETKRIISEVGPRYVLLENTPGLLLPREGGEPNYALTVLSDLAGLGYMGLAGVVSAKEIGASQTRERWWCLAYTSEQRLEGRLIHEGSWLRSHEPSSVIKSMGESGSSGRAGEPRRRTGAVSKNGYTRLADAESEGLEGYRGIHIQREDGQLQTANDRISEIYLWPPGRWDYEGWAKVLATRPGLRPSLSKEAESAIRGMVDGTAARVGQLKALGNGWVPQVAARFLRITMSHAISAERIAKAHGAGAQHDA